LVWFCFDDKKLYRQATQDNTTVAKQCNFVAAKAFLKIVIFAKFEIEKRDDNNFSVKHWKGRRIVRFGNNKSHLVCFVVCITGQYWSPLVPKVPLNQTSGFYKLNPKKTREHKHYSSKFLPLLQNVISVLSNYSKIQTRKIVS